jgi:hypothetical protein
MEKSGDEVSVQNSEVKKITKDQYDSVADRPAGRILSAEAEKKGTCGEAGREAKAAQQKAEQQAA